MRFSKEFTSLVSLLQRGLVNDGDADEMVSLMRRNFALSGLALGSDFSYVTWHRIGGDLGDWPRVYTALADQDTTVGPIRAAPPGSWFLIRAADEYHRRAPVFRAFLKEGFQDAAITHLGGLSGDGVSVGLYRERGARNFSDDDDAQLTMLHPLLARALAAKAALDTECLYSAPAEDLSDGFVFLSFPTGEVEWTTRSRRLWEKSLGPISDQGWKRIERALTRAALRKGPAPFRQHLTRDVAVEFVNVPPQPGQRHRMMGHFFRTPGLPDSVFEPEAQCPGEELLSPRQRVVVRLVCCGWSAPRVARQLGLSSDTVRQHLEQACLRLGAENRVDLARILR